MSNGKNYSLFKDIIILLTFIGVVMILMHVKGISVTSEANAADMSMHRDVIAIQSVPQKTHSVVSVEGAAYYDTDSNEEVFTAGAGFALGGVSLGVAVAYDGMEYMDDSDNYSLAVGTSVNLGNHANLKVGVAPDLEGDKGLGTVGAKINFGF